MFIDNVNQSMIRAGSPMVGQPAQRRRIDDETRLLWRRFIDEASPHKRLVLKEQPNPDIFENILTKHANDPTIKNNLESKINPMKRLLEGSGWSRTTEMVQRNGFPFPSNYKGCHAVSRSYGQQLTYMPKKFLNTLYHDTHTCVDMVNSHYNIILNFFDHLDIPFIRFYATNRDAVISEFASMGLSAKETKTAFLSLIGACPKIPIDFGLGGSEGNQEKIRVLSENAGVLGVYAELKKCFDQLAIDYPEFVAGMSEHASREGRSDHRAGVAFCHFCFDVEDAITRTAVEILQDGYDDDLAKNMVWKFDGLIVPKNMVHGGQDILIKIQDGVRQKLGLNVRYAFNQLDLDVYPECGAGFRPDPYTRFKADFERTYFKLLEPISYARMNQGEVQLLGKDQWRLIHTEKPKPMVERWEEDPDKRMYSKMDCYPPPLIAPPGVLNTWDGFAIESYLRPMSDQEIEERFKMWDVHLDNMMGHDPIAIKCQHNLLAHMFQKPGIKTGKLMFIRSIQGTGKDQMTKFILNIMGPKLACKFDTFEELRGSKSQVLQGKIYVVISEASYKDFTDKSYNAIKSMTTRDTFLIQQKYVPDYIGRCYLNMAFMTNDMGHLNMNVMERRFVCAQADSRIANDPLYHVPFAAYIEDPANQAAVYRYYKKMDISAFNPFEQVLTKVQVDMSQLSMFSSPMVSLFGEHLKTWIDIAGTRGNPEITRLSDTCIQVSANTFNEEYYAFHQRLGWKGCENLNAAAQIVSRNLTEANAQASKYAPTGIVPIEKKRKRLPGSGSLSNPKIVYCIHIPTVQRWITEMTGDAGEDIEPDGPLPDAFARMKNSV